MATEWKAVRSDTKPAMIDTVTSPSCIYLRKNVKEVEITETDGTVRKEFNYLEQELTPAEYATKMASTNAEAIAELAELIGG